MAFKTPVYCSTVSGGKGQSRSPSKSRMSCTQAIVPRQRPPMVHAISSDFVTAFSVMADSPLSIGRVPTGRKSAPSGRNTARQPGRQCACPPSRFRAAPASIKIHAARADPGRAAWSGGARLRGPGACRRAGCTVEGGDRAARRLGRPSHSTSRIRAAKPGRGDSAEGQRTLGPRETTLSRTTSPPRGFGSRMQPVIVSAR
jgi:hypothetical protein